MSESARSSDSEENSGEEYVRETQADFFLKNNSYPLRGRPYGIAFVWSNAYLDSRGAGGLMISVNSAAAVAEALQLVGFEVRTRSNMRKKIFMDELAEDKISELRDIYDCALVYLCGRGDGESYITQDNQRISISEIHEALDHVGMDGKPRIIIMDFVEAQAKTEEKLLSELTLLQKEVSGMKSDLEIMTSQNVAIPPRLQEHFDKLESELQAKLAEKAALRKPPSAGIAARTAVARLPIRSAYTRWTIKIHRLGYAIGFGVCLPDGLGMSHGEPPLEEYSGLHDFLGNDEFGWSFNQVGQSFHNECSKSGKPTWGKPVHIVQGDTVTLLLDSIEGILSLEVPGKFKSAQTKFKHEGMVYRAGGPALHMAVTLFDDGDAIEVLDYAFGSAAALASAEGLASWDEDDLWDPVRVGKGLQLEGRVVRRDETVGVPHTADSVLILCRQPCKVVPRSFTERGEPRGEKFIGLYDQEAEETNSCTLFSHYFVRRLRSSQRTDDDGYNKGLVEDVLSGVNEDLSRYAMQAWIQGQCNLSGKRYDEVLQTLRSVGHTVDSVKKIVEKSKLEDMGIEHRQSLDSTFKTKQVQLSANCSKFDEALNERVSSLSDFRQAIAVARNESCLRCQKVQLLVRNDFDGRRVVFSCPPCIWSRLHKSINVAVSEDGSCMSKRGQAMASATIMCALESELRSPRMYGPLLAGGGKHAWDWTIRRLRSSQGDELEQIGGLRLGIVQTAAILHGAYSVAEGQCRGGTNTTVLLEKGSASEDGAYEGMHIVITKGRASGHISRIFGYTAVDATADVLFQEAPDETSFYIISRLEGFEVGDDVCSWALTSSTNGRSAAMHGNTAEATFKAYPEQGPPAKVNRVTAAGYEQPSTFPRFLGNALKEGDVVSAWLDLEAHTIAFSLNGELMGEAIKGIIGPVVPAASCTAATDCDVHIGNYRRWAPESGWASVSAEEMGFTDAELELLKAQFRFFAQGKGGVATADLKELLKTLGVKCSESEMGDIIDGVDSDGSGTLDLMEFLQLMSRMKEDQTWDPP